MRRFGAREAGQTVDVVRQRRERARGLSLLPSRTRGVQGGVGVGPAPRVASPRVLDARHAHRRGLVHPRRDPPGLRQEVRQRTRVPQSAGVLAAGARRVRLGRRARRRRRIVSNRVPPDGDGGVPGDKRDDDERRRGGDGTRVASAGGATRGVQRRGVGADCRAAGADVAAGHRVGVVGGGHRLAPRGARHRSRPGGVLGHVQTAHRRRGAVQAKRRGG